MNTIFFVGIRPKNYYLLPENTNVMLSASAYFQRKTGTWEKRYGPKKAGLVFLDSGGYMLFKTHGDYPFTMDNYHNLVSRVKPDFYASMDYPCEMGDTQSNIERTVHNAKIMTHYEDMLPNSTMVPVIQGFTIEEYKYCIRLYAKENLIKPYMAIGTLCNRSRSSEITEIIGQVYLEAVKYGVERIHLFGVKQTPYLERVRHMIYSQDSAALFFAPNDKVKAEWDGRRYARGAAEKRQAVGYFLDRLSKHNYIWKTP